MIRRNTPIKPVPTAPNLVVPRSDASERLSRQVERGKQLKNQEISNEDTLKDASTEYSRWNSYNYELLTRLFDSNTIAENYAGWNFGGLSMDVPFNRRMNYFREKVDYKINKSEDIWGRLELIPEPMESTATRSNLRRTGADSRKVFVVHGHDDATKQTIARFLERLDLEVIILHEQPGGGRTIIEKFEDHADVAFAVVLLTPDDVGFPRDKLENGKPRARQNVVFEMGYFVGVLGCGKVCTLYGEGVELPSDLAGVEYVPLDAGGAWRFTLAREIKQSGLDVDLNKVV